jgi:catalase
MPSRKKTSAPSAPSIQADNLGTVLSTVSGPSSTHPPHPDLAAAGVLPELITKVAASAELSAAVVWNENKPGEHGKGGYVPQPGWTVDPSDPVATASTVSEANVSDKTGGAATIGVNNTIEPLDRVRVDSSAQPLTTNHGVLIADNQNSLKIGLRGPTALEDFILREKITHFDHERIPERVVHARGSAAHGYFESYKALTELTKAAPFQAAGKRTPVFVRFSTVAGERGSADTVRDVRGFAVKFYTDEGNWDLVGNNIPVFFIQDAMKFPDLIHAVKPEPHNAMPQASSAHDTFWDFASLMPESTHMLLWQMSDRAIPRSYRTMQGFGVHTFRLVNERNESVFCKFHWTPVAGTHSLDWDEAVKICGADADFHRRDLWEAIEAGAYPEWELGLQVFSEQQAESFPFDVLDSTKLVPEELVPVVPVGKMVLNRNPDNFFAETEQVAFCTAHIVPGIDFSNDPLLQGRIHSYLDTQLTRLGGPNFHEIPINAPIVPVHNNQRDGLHRQAIPRGRVSYEPNSLAGGCPFQAGAGAVGQRGGFVSFPATPERASREDKVRGKPEKFADHYSQATLFWVSQSPIEQDHIVRAFRFELTRVQTQAIRERIVSMLANVHPDLAQRVADGLGFPVPPPMPLAMKLPPVSYAPSPALSLFYRPGDGSIKARRVAILVAPGVEAPPLRALYAALISLGAAPRYVGVQLGAIAGDDGAPIHVEATLETMPSVLYDALVVPDGEAAIDVLRTVGHAVEYVKDQFRHGKPMLVLGAGSGLLDEAGVSPKLPSGHDDPGIVFGDSADSNVLGEQFIEAISLHRHFIRLTDPPAV